MTKRRARKALDKYEKQLALARQRLAELDDLVANAPAMRKEILDAIATGEAAATDLRAQLELADFDLDEVIYGP